MPHLILASTSPRRRELLALLGVAFEVESPDFIEHVVSGRDPMDLVRSFALGKARAVGRLHPESVVLGSDTLIEIEGIVIGKPANAVEARTMLRQLQGRLHHIHTAVAVVEDSQHREQVGVETVRVEFRSLTDREIDAYVASGEGLDKAGAYSIQGAGGDLIANLDGDFPAAVGLPLRLAARLLGEAGISIGIDVEDLYRRKPYPNWARFAQ